MNPDLFIDARHTSDSVFRAFDRNDPSFFIDGAIQTYTDALVFRIRTRVRSTGVKSTITPVEMFDAMMEHFQTTGGLPAYLRGIWDDRDPEFTTNLNQFNRSVLAGASLSDAALATATGHLAARWNYTVAIVTRAEPNSRPGHYSEVQVAFKPDPSTTPGRSQS